MQAVQQHAESESQKYRIIQDRLYESDFDKLVKKIDVTSDNDSPLQDETKKDSAE